MLLNKINLNINLKDLYYNYVCVNIILIDWIVFNYKDYVIIFDFLYSIKFFWLLNKFFVLIEKNENGIVVEESKFKWIKFDYKFKGLLYVLLIDLYYLIKNFVLF